MSAKKITTAAATVIAAGAAAGITPTTAFASFPGANGSLTISKGDNVLHFANGVTSRPMPSTKVTDAEWAPDGSRVVYLDENNDLVTVRSDGTDKIVVAPGLTGATHPTWMLNGSFIVFAQNGDLYKVPSLGGTAPVKLPAGHQAGHVDSAPQGGLNGTLVFQRIDPVSMAPSVWLFDAVTGNSGPVKGTGGGMSPSLSPDGKTVAFVKKDGQVPAPVSQIMIIGIDGNNLVPLTADTGPTANNDFPVWSPDGSTIAFDSLGAGEVRTVAATAGASEQSAAPLNGRISWQPNANTAAAPSATNPVNLVERLAGSDRIATAVQVSKWTWADQATNPPPAHQADVVVLARSDIFADALAGSALAARVHGPLLLTHTAYLDQATLDEMRRILKPGSFVYVLGLDKAISLNTQAQVDAAGFRSTRIGGPDRFETAVDIAKWIVPDYSTKPVNILTATGMNFPDALAAGAVAGSRPNTVVVLTNDKTMPANTLGFINSVPQRTVFGIGGAAVTALQSVNIPATSVKGDDRFITASMVAHTFFGGPQVVGIATGYNFPDALAGGALAGSAGGPLLLTGPTLLPTQTADYLRSASGSVSDAVMFGGPAVLDDGLKVQVGELISQPGQWVYAENDPARHVGPLVAAP